ncbi:ribonuclease T2 family protein [Rhodospirillum rubrum]|uniref:ribonuclease T2 family protein n=1 Tax=Rhodospirillum rubrum TaxID=1085 RepID=UPI001F5BCF92|nr:ribonuclease T [Rhodospirillum rubrum]
MGLLVKGWLGRGFLGRFLGAGWLLAAPALSPALAEEPLVGSFLAERACPAFVSLRKQTNPGEVHLEVGRAYPVTAANRAAATHVLLSVAEATPTRRWAALDCGRLAGKAGAAPSSAQSSTFVLALSWQPAFCEGRPTKPECASQTADRLDADHFALHGLWPQPRGRAYCGVDAAAVALDKEGAWDRLPAVALSEPTRRALVRAMPGTASFLDRHEWIKHGTCAGAGAGPGAEAYYAASLALVEAINASPVRALVAGRIGGRLETADLRQAFDAAFGAGAGQRVSVSCVRDGGRSLISEIKLALAGPLGPDGTGVLAARIAAVPPVDPGCPGGIVDAVGAQ